MAVTIKEKDLLFGIINIVAFLLFLAMELESEVIVVTHTIVENASPDMTAPLYILHTQAMLIAKVVFVIIIFVDVWWAIRKYNERNKGWL